MQPGPAVNRNLVGRCGVYCGACEIRRGFEDAGKLRLDVAQKHNCMPGDVRCNGCRSVHIIGWSRAKDYGKNCAILACLKTRGLETCGDCEKLSSCDRWRKLAEHCLEIGVYLKANLQAIQQHGVDAWLQAQEERWQCQACGRPVAVDSITPRCHRCGVYQL